MCIVLTVSDYLVHFTGGIIHLLMRFCKEQAITLILQKDDQSDEEEFNVLDETENESGLIRMRVRQMLLLR